jgi:4a-hydroxytetrahydrobiopterin dehydratase
MKTFTKVLEKVENDKFFKIDAEIQLILKTDSEGEAGYLSDYILSNIEEQTYFSISNIEEIQKLEYERLTESTKASSWIEKDGFLQRIYEFDSFLESIDFVNKLATLCEENDHHPKIAINFSQVKVMFKTNKVDDITDIDYQMSEKVDQIYQKN